MDTYDDAAYDRFCSGLVNAGFEPVNTEGDPCWAGPIRPSLRTLTQATCMRVAIYPGWPLRYAHVIGGGLRTDHAADGVICLWAEDDPAQIEGRDLERLWDRLDQWAATAAAGFRPADRALDAHRLYATQSTTYRAELPFRTLVDGGTGGYTAEVYGTMQGATLLIEHGSRSDPRTLGRPILEGAFYLCANRIDPPRTFDEFSAALTRRQRKNLRRGLATRSETAFAKASGGHDFVVLAWPRHDDDHDAVVLGFAGSGDAVRSAAMAATANDPTALRRRAGPDAETLAPRWSWSPVQGRSAATSRWPWRAAGWAPCACTTAITSAAPTSSATSARATSWDTERPMGRPSSSSNMRRGLG